MRVPQFRLRSVFVALTLLSILTAIASRGHYSAARREATVREIERRGGHVTRGTFPVLMPPWRENAARWLGYRASQPVAAIWGSRVFDDALLHRCAQFPEIEVLKVSESPISSEGLRVLRHFPNLTLLELDHCPIDDNAVDSICTCQKLTQLWISDTKISDSGFRKIARSLTLERVAAYRSYVSPEVWVDEYYLPILLAESRSGENRFIYGLRWGPQLAGCATISARARDEYLAIIEDPFNKPEDDRKLVRALTPHGNAFSVFELLWQSRKPHVRREVSEILSQGSHELCTLEEDADDLAALERLVREKGLTHDDLNVVRDSIRILDHPIFDKFCPRSTIQAAVRARLPREEWFEFLPEYVETTQ